MGSVGFQNAFGQQAMAEQIRQRMIDALNQKKTEHGMSVEDQRLALEKQRYDQEAQDRSLLRQQQGQVFNESLAEKTASNLTPQSIISPQLAERFKNTSLAPLIKSDETLPSTSMAAAAPMVGAPTPDVAPTVTQNAPQLTGQLRYSGTPTQIASDNQKAIVGRLIASLPPNSAERRALEYEQGTGKNAPAGIFDKTSTEPLEQVSTPTGPKYVPRSQAVGATPYHAPQTPVVVQTDNGFASVNRGNNTATPILDAQGNALKPKTGQTVESRLQSAQAVAQTGNDIIKRLSDPAVMAKLGPAMSRYNTVADFVGNPPPEFSELAGLIESYSLANMGVHGMRSNTGAEAIKGTLGLNRHTPESIIATIRGLNGFANHFMENNGMMPVSSHETVGPPTPANAAWKVIKP